MPKASVREIEGEGNERRFRLSFASEEPYGRFFGTEILDCKEGAADLSRLNEIGVVLYNHDRYYVIGRIIKAWAENNRLEAEIEIDSDEKSETVFQKMKSGTLKGVSVGYTVGSWEEVAANNMSSDGRFAGPCSIARNWTPLEVSIVSVPADASIGVGRGFEDNKATMGNVYEWQFEINKRR